jgi:hypothetical protein
MRAFTENMNLFGNDSANIGLNISFLTVRSQLKMTSRFKNHQAIVDQLIGIDKLWEAKVNPQFENMTVEQMNRFAGRNKGFKSNMDHSLAQSELRFKLEQSKSGRDIDYPAFYDLKKFITPSSHQVCTLFRATVVHVIYSQH